MGKAVNVTNPMTTDLDAGTNQHVNVGGISFNGDENNIGLNYFATHELMLSVDPGPIVGATVSVMAGTADPTVTSPGAAVAVYVRQVTPTHREMWFNTGAGWTKVAG